jgi:hypothetical protein
MGQYYNPVNIDKIQWLYSHDYDNGLKLMEHSYQHNNFVGAVMKLLTKGGAWYKNRLVWAGDYGEKRLSDFPVPDAAENMIQTLEGGDATINNLCNDGNKLPVLPGLSESEWANHVVVNHTKKQYYRSKDLFPIDGVGGDDMVICPLPLLTSDGNGQGGGDYDGEYMSLVGLWAGDQISVEFEIPDGYQDIKPEFRKGR